MYIYTYSPNCLIIYIQLQSYNPVLQQEYPEYMMNSQFEIENTCDCKQQG